MDIIGVILAGGMSSRFGSDKAKAMLGDKTMIRHVYDLLKQVCVDVILSGRDEAEGLPTDVKCIPDIEPHGGPMSGIISVLQNIDAEWLLIMPCDMPLMTINNITETIQEAHKGKTVTWRNPDGKIQPFPLLLNRQDALSTTKTPGMSMTEFLSKLPKTEIDISPEQLSKFSNINTTKELGNLWHNQQIHSKILA